MLWYQTYHEVFCIHNVIDLVYMKDDMLNGNFTTFETLKYTADLRLEKGLTRQQKNDIIDDVMLQMGISHARNTIVGTPIKKGISGGERKRLCVAMELITGPKLLFLDEPTSGLDSVTALSLCTKLRALAKDCTIVNTIHQPQAKIFRLFDKLILLKVGCLFWLPL
jgi:ATP-binding cassette subfamily G (WHITE) protein 2